MWLDLTMNVILSEDKKNYCLDNKKGQTKFPMLSGGDIET